MKTKPLFYLMISYLKWALSWPNSNWKHILIIIIIIIIIIHFINNNKSLLL